MKVTLVPSSVSARGNDQEQYLISYLINDTVAVDAGCLGFYLTPAEQARVRHVFLSHTHADHVASLPIFVENSYEAGQDCVIVHGSQTVLDCLQADIFNERVWPDFIELTAKGLSFLKLSRLEHGQPIEVEGLKITPIDVDHLVPTQGFLIEDASSAVVIASDTGPTQAIWEHARNAPNLKAIFLEASFPNEMKWLAETSRHLTPAMFGAETAKVAGPVRWIAVHLKARFRAQIIAELDALNLPEIEIGRFGVPYEF